MTITEGTSIREIASALAGATRVFDRLGIEWGCSATHSLREACDRIELDVDEALRELRLIENKAPVAEGTYWRQASATDLISHILDVHHAYLKEELPRLEKLMHRVYEKHGPEHPELLKVQEVFFSLKGELEQHLYKEEMMLFPYIVRLETSEGASLHCPFGTVENPIRVMMSEHQGAVEALISLRAHTSDYTAPDTACLGFKLLLEGLKELEADLTRHIELEEGALFTRATLLERGAA